MSLQFAEHSVTVYARVETPDASTKVVPVPTEAVGLDDTVQIEPIRAESVFDSVTGVELTNPYRMFVEPEKIENYPYGTRVVWHDEDLTFRITKKAMRHKAGGDVEDLDHGVAEMELLEYED
jgi:hypothetical protein